MGCSWLSTIPTGTRRCTVTRHGCWLKRVTPLPPAAWSDWWGRQDTQRPPIFTLRYAETVAPLIRDRSSTRSTDMAMFTQAQRDGRDSGGRAAPREAALSIVAAGTRIMGEVECDGVLKIEG